MPLRFRPGEPPSGFFVRRAQGLVLQEWPSIRHLFGLLAGVCCVVLGLAIFMEVRAPDATNTLPTALNSTLARNRALYSDRA